MCVCVCVLLSSQILPLSTSIFRYEIDFKKMKQISPKHKFERKIRRVSPNAVKIEKWMHESYHLQNAYSQMYRDWIRGVERKIKKFEVQKTGVTLMKKRSSDSTPPIPPAPPLLKSRSTHSLSLSLSTLKNHQLMFIIFKFRYQESNRNASQTHRG